MNNQIIVLIELIKTFAKFLFSFIYAYIYCLVIGVLFGSKSEKHYISLY